MHAQGQRSRENSSPREADAAVSDWRQSLIREVNQRIEELSSEWEENGSAAVFCECAEPECLETIEISQIAYEPIRGSAMHFLVKPDHVATEDERIVAATDEYAVVEKLEPRPSGADRSDERAASREDRETRP